MKKSKLHHVLSALFALLIVSTAVCSYVNPCVGEECSILSEELEKHTATSESCAHAHHFHAHHNFVLSATGFDLEDIETQNLSPSYENLTLSYITTKIYRPPIC
ncbi:MAG: hypothetical protein PHE89_00900 [Alphaproteobacteria bacterium]|nr:hypothetical protein [Alphaproteobacteria bacterium]